MHTRLHCRETCKLPHNKYVFLFKNYHNFFIRYDEILGGKLLTVMFQLVKREPSQGLDLWGVFMILPRAYPGNPQAYHSMIWMNYKMLAM